MAFCQASIAAFSSTGAAAFLAFSWAKAPAAKPSRTAAAVAARLSFFIFDPPCIPVKSIAGGDPWRRIRG